MYVPMYVLYVYSMYVYMGMQAKVDRGSHLLDEVASDRIFGKLNIIGVFDRAHMGVGLMVLGA